MAAKDTAAVRYRVDRTGPRTKGGMSPALLLIDHVWNLSQKQTGHSWTRLNQVMRDSVRLAIDGGMRFDVGDFGHIRSHYNSSYWLDLEWWYSRAVERGHVNACQAIEALLLRPPFILNGSRLCVDSKPNDCIQSVERQRECDVAEMKMIEWIGWPQARVTSFPDGDSFIVSSTWDGKKHRSKPARRWTITRDMLRECNAVIRRVSKRAKEADANGNN
jgi:hypothetical protein